MDLNQFFSRLSSAPAGAFNSRYYNQTLPEEMRELARLGLRIFPVSLAAKLNGCPDCLIADATDEISLIEELSAAAQPLWGYRGALGPSGLCVLVLEGEAGRTSLASLVPDLDECFTLKARRGDAVFVFFRQPAGTQRIASAMKLGLGVSILGDGTSCDVPPTGGAVWVNPGADIDVIPFALLELLVSRAAGQSSGARDASAKAFFTPAGPQPVHRVFPAAR
jgi:hypothetical protein